MVNFTKNTSKNNRIKSNGIAVQYKSTDQPISIRTIFVNNEYNKIFVVYPIMYTCMTYMIEKK